MSGPTPSGSPPSVDELRQQCALLLSHFAWAEHRGAAQAQQAYQHGSTLAPLDHLPPLRPKEQVCHLEVDQALSQFSATKPAFKARLFKALAAVALQDGRITTQERRLIQQVGAILEISDDDIEAALTLPPAGSDSADQTAQIAQSALTQGSLKQALFPGPLTLPGKALILANLIPLFGVLFLGWDAGSLLLLYWLENIVIGFYTLVRMFHACGIKAIGIALFFTFHYSAFCGVHGMIVLALSATLGEGSILEGGDDDGFILFFPFLMLAEVFRNIMAYHPLLLTLPLLSFLISHGISTVTNNLIGKEDEGRKAESIMADPYRRIAILHIALIIGAGAVLLSGAGSISPILIILIGMKIALDLYEHNRYHRNRMQAKTATTPDTTE